VGKAARCRRQGTARQGAPASRNRRADGGGLDDDPRGRAQAAVTRLVRGNPLGKVSLAGAYALGFGALGMAQMEGMSRSGLRLLFLGALTAS